MPSAICKIPLTVKLKHEIFMSGVQDEEVASKDRHPTRERGNKYGVGPLSAGVQRGKINCTRQPPAEDMLPKHGVSNEASETRCDQRGNCTGFVYELRTRY
ncbi:hypothetical protein EV401DRAFT_1889977 [Pisolithus croceorrhizus]|nr:hypothetical protein EV401DRAFT_1889977 [Pisolithus croceorrhizus]